MWGLTSLQAIEWSERKDLIVYSRYFEHTIGPLLLISILTAINNKRIAIWGIVAARIVAILLFSSVKEKIETASEFFNSICSPIVGTFYDNYVNEQAFIQMNIFISCFFILLILACLVKKDKTRAIIFISSFLIGYIMVGSHCDVFMDKHRSYQEANLLPIKNEIDGAELKEIYYIPNTAIDYYSVNPKYLQFMVPDTIIHIISYEKVMDCITQETIILTNPNDEEGNSFLNKLGLQYTMQTNMFNVYKYQK